MPSHKEVDGNKSYKRPPDRSKTVRTQSRPSGLTLIALGVVFGDIGTSPLYALRECFHGEYGIAASRDNILGVLSLMFWTLVVIVSLKYVIFVLRADNKGEGGVIALTSLLGIGKERPHRSRRILLAAGLFAAALLYGDGMITPSISVLSAVEGLGIITPAFQPFVIPTTVAILVGLFLLQQRGTARLGSLFGPVILVWFLVLGSLGMAGIARNPQVLAAVWPIYGIKFLLYNQFHGFLVLGAVFLVATGAEALYADLGHFGKRPIRLAWFGLVLPALLLNYFGQGSVLLDFPDQAYHPFYALVPVWGKIPVLIIATVSTVIASQAVITGAFSLTRQAVQMGLLPRMRIVHTSARHFGQIYVPTVNWILMVATVVLVLVLNTSSKLAAAYGVAVTSTMLITTVLFYVLIREGWHWSRPAAGLLCGLFLLADVSFLSANIGKIAHGAWFPLVVGMIAFAVMSTWKRGREILVSRLPVGITDFKSLEEYLDDNPPQKTRGQAIYMTGRSDVVPPALIHNLKHNRVLHTTVVFLHIRTQNQPRVRNRDKVEIQKLGNGFFRVIANYGFMESPKMRNIVDLAREQGVDINLEDSSFFLGREKLVPAAKSTMARWRTRLFMFLSRNSMDPAVFYGIPTDRIVEVGIRLEL